MPRLTTRRRSVASIANAAHRLGVSPDTVRNYIKRGYFPVYRVPGRRGHFVDVAEAREALARQPRSKVRRRYGQFGPDATVIDLQPLSESGARK